MRFVPATFTPSLADTNNGNALCRGDVDARAGIRWRLDPLDHAGERDQFRANEPREVSAHEADLLLRNVRAKHRHWHLLPCRNRRRRDDATLSAPLVGSRTMGALMRRVSAMTGLSTFFVIGVVQLAATTAGLKAWLGIPAALAFFLSLFVAWVPLVGTTLGFFGAISAWGWPELKAGILFFGAFLVVVALVGVAARDEWRAATGSGERR